MDKKSIIGEFTTKDKFIQFIGAKGNINFISNEAFIDGKYLSGLGLDGIKFKLTICDEGTVNFDEVDTNQTTKEERGRLLEVISEKTIVPSRNKMMIINELPFMSVKQINGKEIRLYLAVDYKKPIEKLVSLLDDRVDISYEQSSKLDSLISIFDDETTSETMVMTSNGEIFNIKEGEKTVESIPPIYDHNKQIRESFDKIREDKINELDKILESKKKELVKFTQDVRLSTKKVDDTENEIKLLESRLESLKPEVQFIGYYFNVSEKLNESINLDPEVADLIKSKISKVKSINPDAFMKLFEDGEYHIRLGSKSEDIINEITDYQNISEEAQKAISKIGIKLSDGKLIYMGELNWGEIVNKMVKSGFGQDSDFDKNCGSNSYKASQYVEVDLREEETPVEGTPSSNYEFQDEFKSKELKTYDHPTTLVVMGSVDHNNNCDIKIYDDFTGFEVYVGDKKTKYSIESDGFISFMTLSQFKIWQNNNPHILNGERSGFGSFLLPNFIGSIGIGAIKSDGEFTNDFDLDDYIVHQLNCDEVFLNLPEGTKIIDMEKHQIPIDSLRDFRINDLLNDSQDEFKSKELKTYDQPTTLVVVGNLDHNSNSNLNIYEDFIRIAIYVGDKKIKKSIETYGHISFMTLAEFEIWKTMDIEAMEDCESFLLPDFKGTIGVAAINQDGKFTTDFDLNEYLQYLDGISRVFLTLPEGTEIVNMVDHEIPADVLRDIKIKNIISL